MDEMFREELRRRLKEARNDEEINFTIEIDNPDRGERDTEDYRKLAEPDRRSDE
ncbi:MAG: hypothetical protein K5750_08045 [Eubacterium sp.]|nr:hypothetical protein [Eubacterium sp.]